MTQLVRGVCNTCTKLYLLAGKVTQLVRGVCNTFTKLYLLAGKVTQLVRGFNSDWKKAIELINQDVMRSFTNFKNGTQIMQVLMISLHYQNREICR